MDAPGTLSAARLRAAPRITREFFDRDPVTVARALLGKLLVRRERRNLLAGRIVEVESYLGIDDPAAHAFNGRTARNAVLFGPPGHAYVYFIYGNHYCTNVSCQPDGHGGGVLFRALEPVFGLAVQVANRGFHLPTQPTTAQLRLISSGPGRLSQALGITRMRDNGKDFTAARSDLYFADDGYAVAAIAATPRVGISKAKDRPLRFLIAGNQSVSAPRF